MFLIVPYVFIDLSVFVTCAFLHHQHDIPILQCTLRKLHLSLLGSAVYLIEWPIPLAPTEDLRIEGAIYLT
jgi:hypothetical protein